MNEYDNKNNDIYSSGSDDEIGRIIEEVKSPDFCDEIPNMYPNEVGAGGYQNEAGNPYAQHQNFKKSEKGSYNTLKTQNNILKAISLLLVIGVFAGCAALGLHSRGSNATTSLLLSDNNRNTIVTSVKAKNDPMSASEVYKENIDSVVAIQTEIITRNIFNQNVKGAVAGSGFVVSEDGYILTNYHVIEGATKISVTFANNKTYTAEIVGMDKTNDVAVIKLNSDETFKPVVFGDSESIEIGEDVVAVGNPLGELTFSLTKGVVSAKDRLISTDLYTGINMFQVDCSVNEGNSGGPIFNMYGEVIGIVSAKYASNTIEGLGFCIPANDAVTIMKELITNGKVTNRGSLGIKVNDMTTSEIEKFNLVSGAYVFEVAEGSAADKAGMKVGDIIVEYNGKMISNVNSLLSIKRNSLKGEEVSVKVWRNGEYIDLKVVLDGEIVETKEDNKSLDNSQEKEYDNYQDYLEDRQNRQNNRVEDNEDIYNYSDMDDIFRYFFGY